MVEKQQVVQQIVVAKDMLHQVVVVTVVVMDMLHQVVVVTVQEKIIQQPLVV